MATATNTVQPTEPCVYDHCAQASCMTWCVAVHLLTYTTDLLSLWKLRFENLKQQHHHFFCSSRTADLSSTLHVHVRSKIFLFFIIIKL